METPAKFVAQTIITTDLFNQSLKEINRRREMVKLQANHSGVLCLRGVNIIITKSSWYCACRCGEVHIRNTNSLSSQEYAKCADWDFCPRTAGYLISKSEDRCWCEMAWSCTNTSLSLMRRPLHVLCPNFFSKKKRGGGCFSKISRCSFKNWSTKAEQHSYIRQEQRRVREGQNLGESCRNIEQKRQKWAEK